MPTQPPLVATRRSRPESALRLRGLRMRFGAVTALDGIDLDVRPGEVLVLAGPNGAGKTTLMHLAAGLFAPDAGEIFVAGLSDPTRPIVRRHIGVATQALALYAELTAAENVAFFGCLHGIAGVEVESRVAEVLDVVGLAERRHDRVRTLSGGMQRRLNLACALVHRPRLLLLDEPTAGVDPQSRNDLLRTIGELRDGGQSIVYATHHMEEAARICDRVAILDRGRIVALDTLDRLTARHDGDLERALLALTGGGSREASQ